ncbi:MAG: hypothetical protein KME60_02630 [Cyanomargarita calcarea GSE-NOS-MK-12-04C]|jgi:hypothetical protein|uniref:Uncharacterized protein n=1 Tax=Cyanomargarita calcarea GSE-NOS-MK-12-04C TaxID=2839659 RepID=A0A951QJW2_9CYAN|nr:hypothetical protein [Cyanomargarita calcarea GSE-NOS-MK-12-04C]
MNNALFVELTTNEETNLSGGLKLKLKNVTVVVNGAGGGAGSGGVVIDSPGKTETKIGDTTGGSGIAIVLGGA